MDIQKTADKLVVEITREHKVRVDKQQLDHERALLVNNLNQLNARIAEIDLVLAYFNPDGTTI